MDHVADPTLDVEGAHELVFGSSLMRPWLIANFVALTIGSGVAGACCVRSLSPPSRSRRPGWTWPGSRGPALARPDWSSARRSSAKALVIVGAVAGPIYGYGTWVFLAQLRRRTT